MKYSPLIKQILIDLTVNRVYLQPGEKPPKGARLHKGIRKPTARWYSPIKNDVGIKENIKSIVKHIFKSPHLLKKIYAVDEESQSISDPPIKDNMWSTLIADFLGYHDPPKIISEQEFTHLENTTEMITMRRGVGGKSVPDFIAGKNKIQREGLYGAGCYTAMTTFRYKLSPKALNITDNQILENIFLPLYYDYPDLTMPAEDFMEGIEKMLDDLDNTRELIKKYQSVVDIYNYFKDTYIDNILSSFDEITEHLPQDNLTDDDINMIIAGANIIATDITPSLVKDAVSKLKLRYDPTIYNEFEEEIWEDCIGPVKFILKTFKNHINKESVFSEDLQDWIYASKNPTTMGEVRSNLISHLNEIRYNINFHVGGQLEYVEEREEEYKDIQHDISKLCNQMGITMPEELLSTPREKFIGSRDYMVLSRNTHNADKVADSYARPKNGIVLKMALDPSAKIISYRELEDWFPREKSFGIPEGDLGSPISDFINAAIRDEGLKALLQGYDAVRIPRSNTNADEADYILVLNRGKIIMVDPTKSDAS